MKREQARNLAEALRAAAPFSVRRVEGPPHVMAEALARGGPWGVFDREGALAGLALTEVSAIYLKTLLEAVVVQAEELWVPLN